VDAVVDYPDATSTCDPTPHGGIGSSGGAPDASDQPELTPPDTATLEPTTASPDVRFGLLLLLFAGTLAAVSQGVVRRRTMQVPEGSVHIETAEEFMSRVARTPRTGPARRSSAPARSRARRA
jgi:hypothetical protein